MEVVELKVRLHCKACEKSVRKALCKLKGVTCVEMDVMMNKITVLGYIDRKAVVKAVRKTGRRAEAWASCGQDPSDFVGDFPKKPFKSSSRNFESWVRVLKNRGIKLLEGKGFNPVGGPTFY
ncbi:heavy metal-associated isoprenylated plant protein 45-like isoform X2 [Magnolia sinica]|uniref:heavy metal-associated isoprenylated plant protein 45-like isoform X2 n=1 Tax=Magnolia sinica TaxID=86752 RepID=UPI0026590F50|nr:heavy metal-associated isoprenylated plant protein 45-like isoform X2 [Magnolia sinica]